MARVFISGSADGLGLLAAQWLVERGHEVTLHARNEARADACRKALPAARDVVIGDVATIAAMVDVAAQVNALPRHDAIIHNVAIGYREASRQTTGDGLSQLFAINVLAPYVLTAAITRPDRLIYLSSGMHRGGDTSLEDLQWQDRRWNGSQAYADSKFLDLLIAFGVARRWTEVLSNAVEPGWVPTKMGGRGAPDDLSQGAVTQAWLAVSDEPAVQVSGRYFFHQAPRSVLPAAQRAELQDRLLDECHALSGLAVAG